MAIYIVPISILIGLIFIGIVASKLYVRSRQDMSFVRTGLGGLKVVKSGGAIVLPVFQEIVRVNANTLKLEVKKANEESLITFDRLRVDTTVEFYLKVGGDDDSISKAAQTLGDLTNDPEKLKVLIEGKLVDALRSTAARMTMSDLHEKRTDFIAGVKESLSEDLAKNGLELESASLTSLNQTDLKYFKDDNAFDAAGRLILTTAVQASLKARNEIEQDTGVQMAQKNLEATQSKLTIQKQEQDAKLTTQQEIEQRTADTNAEIKKTQANRNLEAETVVIETQRTIDTQKLEAQSIVLAKEQAIIKAQQEVSEQRIQSETAVTTREQEAKITIAQKSQDVAQANAEANVKLAEEIKTQEGVTTARDVAVAERQKAISLVQADEAAQKDAIIIKVAAEAESAAAEHTAKATITLATANKDAAVLAADAIKATGLANADALQAHNDAANSLSPALVEQQVKLKTIEQLPSIIAESVKPMLNIDSIHIAEVGGLNGASGNGTSSSQGSANTEGSSGLGTEVVNAALRYQALQPVVNNVLASVGLKGSGLDNLVSSAVGAFAAETPSASTAGTPLTAIAPESGAPIAGAKNSSKNSK